MSDGGPTTAEPQRAAPAPAPVPLRCPRCGAYIAPEQDWCLECGAPARTRLAPTPNWRLPVAVIATVVAAALVALVIAFVALTRDDGTVPAATTTAPLQPTETAPASTVPAPPAATTTTPGATTPATTTPVITVPATTTPATTTPAPPPTPTTPAPPGG